MPPRLTTVSCVDGQLVSVNMFEKSRESSMFASTCGPQRHMLFENAVAELYIFSMYLSFGTDQY